MGRELSNDVKKFIAEHVHSVLELEVLLLLSQNRHHACSAEAVDRELHTSLKSAKMILDELVSHGLLTLTHESEKDLYRYNLSSHELDRTINQLATAYAQQRVAVLTLIFANPGDKIRLFTETFRMINGAGDK